MKEAFMRLYNSDYIKIITMGLMSLIFIALFIIYSPREKTNCYMLKLAGVMDLGYRCDEGI